MRVSVHPMLANLSEIVCPHLLLHGSQLVIGLCCGSACFASATGLGACRYMFLVYGAAQVEHHRFVAPALLLKVCSQWVVLRAGAHAGMRT